MKTFTKEFMEQNWNKEIEAATGKKCFENLRGFPDTGCGRFSSKLSYKAWFKFNCAQRAHLNQLEYLVPVCSMVFATSFNCPMLAAIIGMIMFYSRYLYANGYSRIGPKWRVFGALIFLMAMFACFIMFVYSCIMWDP